MVHTREILSRTETRPATKSSLSIMKCLLLFIRFCLDKMSSPDELIHAKKTEKISFQDGILKRTCFLIFDVCI